MKQTGMFSCKMGRQFQLTADNASAWEPGQIQLFVEGGG